METAKRTIIFLVVVLLTAGAAQSAEKPATEKDPSIYTESCLVKVTADPAILPDMVNTIESLFQSSDVGGKAAREMLDTSFDIDILNRRHLSLISTRLLSVPSMDTVVLQLQVNLTEDTKVRARKFLSALIVNLRQALGDAYETHRQQLQIELEQAEIQQEDAQSQLSKIMEQARIIEPPPPIEQNPADLAVYEQLDQVVDLSQLSPETPFAEAIDIIKNSVEPPLKIVVLWRDMLDNAEIEQVTEINMDGIPSVRLGTALELLLKAVSGDFAELDYAIKNGVITVATEESLPSKLETRVYDIPGLLHTAAGANNLVQLIQDVIEPDSWYEAGGEGTISIYLGKKLAVLQTPEIHRKIQKFLQETKMDVPIDIPLDISVEMLLEEKHDLLRDKKGLEMEVARLEARHLAIEEQIAKIGEQAATKIKGDPIMAELRGIINMHTEQQGRVQSLPKDHISSAELEQIREKLARTKIELAKRSEELGKNAGGGQLAKFTGELADIMIDLAEKKAELGVVDKQLKQTESQIIMATTFDPQLSQIRLVKQSLEVTDRRINELKTRLANLQPPTVTVLGAD